MVATVRESKQYPGALRFIVASLLYQDAMGTIISFMALYAVEAMGFARGTETTLFVVLTVPAVVVVAVFVADPLSGITIAVTLPLIVVFMLLVGYMTRDRTERRQDTARDPHLTG